MGGLNEDEGTEASDIWQELPAETDAPAAETQTPPSETENIPNAEGASPYKSAPAMRLAPNEAVVTSFSELKTALSQNNGITTVYFGADITIDVGGISINPNKTNIIVSGLNPNDPNQTVPYTLTDYLSATFTDTIYIGSAGPRSLIIRDLKMKGLNYYGPFSIADLGGLSNLVVTYERVDYNGPQLCHHRQGDVIVIDSTVRIHGGNGGSARQEFGEVKNLEFKGRNTIFTESSLNAVFWLTTDGAFKIADDSSLYLTSPNTSAAHGVFRANGASNKITITIGERALFDATISGSVARSGYSVLSGFTVREGGAFNLTTKAEPPAALLEMNGNFTVEKNASVKINGYGSPAYAVFSQKTGNLTVANDAVFHIIAARPYERLINLYGRPFICDNPLSVVLYNTKRGIEATTSNGTIDLTADQINYWNTAAPEAPENPPLRRWKKANGSSFWIKGTLGYGETANFTSLSSNYETGDEPGEAPSSQTFDMNKARVLALGKLELFVASPTTKSKTITGVTGPGALVCVSFSQGGVDYILPGVIAGPDGVFDVDAGVALAASTVIFVQSYHQYLKATAEAVVSEGGKVEFSVPESMGFFTTELAAGRKLVGRLDHDWKVSVTDTRSADSEWSIYVRLVQPLTPADADKPVLGGALVYIEEDMTETPLGAAGVLVYHHTPSPGDDVVNIHWAADRGVLVRVPEELAYAGQPYRGILEWTFSEVP